MNGSNLDAVCFGFSQSFLPLVIVFKIKFYFVLFILSKTKFYLSFRNWSPLRTSILETWQRLERRGRSKSEVLSPFRTYLLRWMNGVETEKNLVDFESDFPWTLSYLSNNTLEKYFYDYSRELLSHQCYFSSGFCLHSMRWTHWLKKSTFRITHEIDGASEFQDKD